MTDSQQQLEQCPECDGEGEVASTYGGTLYTSGYSDHGHTSWGICPLCKGSKHCTSQQLASWLGIDDFAPTPTYNQTTVRNKSWINVTLTATHSDGSKSQVFFLARK